ncbi:DMT family transporter [Halegenticoccus soli]|uniref:DMT family transporter n=1 Tax=Halegenticoccus soli TaxID=1985678 RepID=UPI000C6DDD21|nr:DMT family transporter [Halegenticoccus soli]
MSALLALVASACFGVQTLLVERGLDRGDTTALGAAAVTLVGSVSFLWAVVFVRRGVPAAPLALVAPFLLAGVADPALTRLFYYEGIDRVGPTVASAITAGSPAVAAVIAVPVLGEAFGVGEAVGLALVVGGIAVLQVVRPSNDGVEADAIRRELADASPRDSLYPVVATALLAAAFVVVKIGLGEYPDALSATALTQTAALATLAPIAAGSTRTRRGLRAVHPRTVGLFLPAGVVVAVGWYAMFAALRVGSVVTVLPLVSTYPLVVAAAAYAAARQLPRSPVLLGAVVAIVAGTASVQAA